MTLYYLLVGPWSAGNDERANYIQHGQTFWG